MIPVESTSGREPIEGVVTACLARLRPILMTTLITVLGLVPLILFGGALFYGMANVITFGLVIGTAVTLGFMPVLYTTFNRYPHRRRILRCAVRGNFISDRDGGRRPRCASE